MALQDQIELLHIKTVALRKAADEHERELEEIKKKKANSAPRVRRDLKAKRIEMIAKNYITGKWKQSKKTA